MSTVSRLTLSAFCLFICFPKNKRDVVSELSTRAQGLYRSPGIPFSKSDNGEQPLLHFMQKTTDFYNYGPRRKHLKTKKLLRRIGSDFDPSFMSVNRPPTLFPSNKIVTGTTDVELIKDLGRLNFTIIGNEGDTAKLKPKLIKWMKKWLIQKATCPVNFTWYDLGALFWPRWIKQGSCTNDRSCSWPPGMHCVPSESRRIKILRWHCRVGEGRISKRVPSNRLTVKNTRRPYSKIRKRKPPCKWLKIPYPVVHDCHCSC